MASKPSAEKHTTDSVPYGDRDSHGPSAKAFPLWLRLVFSMLLLVHFGLIALVYFSNNSLHRTPLVDEALQKCQPYLIGMGWYTELLPMSMVGSESYDKPVAFEYRSDAKSRIWTSWIESDSADSRWKRLGQLAGALAANEDDEGLGQIALSLVKRARREGIEFEQLRIVAKEPEAQRPILLYQATVVPLASGELTLVPTIDATRTVPVSKSAVGGNVSSPEANPTP